MIYKTSIYDHELNEVFQLFRQIIGENNWCQRVKKLDAEIKGNRFLSYLHHKENDIAYALTRCSELCRKYRLLPVGLMDLSPFYPALAFASQCLNILEQMNQSSQKGAIGRIRGAFNNPDDMRALQLEFLIGLHFAKRGHRIIWPELVKGGDTYDLLIEDIGIDGLEIECKSISETKGRRIATRQALDFWHLMQKDLIAATNDLRDGLSIILTLPDKLPNSVVERKELSKLVLQTILGGQSKAYPQITVSIHDFNIQLLQGIEIDNESIYTRELIESITGTYNREYMLMGREGAGAVICTIQSSKDDGLFNAIQQTVKRAATKQLTGTRAGMVLLELDGMTPDGMLSLAKQDNTPNDEPTSLRLWASKFLSNSTDRDHIIGIGFLSNSRMTRPEQHIAASSGTSYMFPRRESIYWDDAFSGLFEPKISP